MKIWTPRIEKKTGRFDLFRTVSSALSDAGYDPKTGDIIVISSKFAAYSQDRILAAGSVRVMSDAARISQRYRMESALAEAVLRESDGHVGGMPGFILASSGGILAPNAGIDRSNARDGHLVLYPHEPHVLAAQLHRKFLLCSGVHVGIIIADSRLMPARPGTVGLAVACAGIEPVTDMRARRDLDGGPLKVTQQATADSVATAANHSMGEASESRPVALVRDSGALLTGRRILPGETTVATEQCIYVRSISGYGAPR